MFNANQSPQAPIQADTVIEARWIATVAMNKPLLEDHAVIVQAAYCHENLKANIAAKIQAQPPLRMAG
jgi:hypothetical protein